MGYIVTVVCSCGLHQAGGNTSVFDIMCNETGQWEEGICPRTGQRLTLPVLLMVTDQQSPTAQVENSAFLSPFCHDAMFSRKLSANKSQSCVIL